MRWPEISQHYNLGKEAWNAWAQEQADVRRRALANSGAAHSSQALDIIIDDNSGSETTFIFDDLFVPGKLIFKRSRAFSISAKNGKFSGGIEIAGSHLNTLSLVDCKILGDVQITTSTGASNIKISTTEILGDLSADGLPTLTTFECSQCTVHGTFSLLNSRAQQALILTGTRFKSAAVLKSSGTNGTFRAEDSAFEADLSLDGFIVNGQTNAARITCGNVIITSDTKFSETADFSGACLLSVTGRLVFSTHVNLTNASIYKDFNVPHSSFRSADFTETHFGGSAIFSDSVFGGAVIFEATQFGGPADFSNSKFGADAVFDRTVARDSLTFRGLQVEKRQATTFIDSVFHQAPEFFEADLKEPPRFDGAIAIGPPPWRKAKDRFETERFRKLKEYALERHDHAQELQFFAQEMRSMRYYKDFPFKGGITRYWIGILYELLSDFGRSIFRPILAATIITLAFAWIYACQSSMYSGIRSLSEASCRADRSLGVEALIVAAGHAIPFGVGRSDQVSEGYKCLFPQPVPAQITFISLGQTILTAVLIFLAILGIRNQFRIR